MGSSTKTYKDLQVQPLIEHPEKVYKTYQLEAFKNIRGGMKAVNNAFQMGMVDTRSMFNDGFLTRLGYNPSETITYTLLDPVLVLSWFRTNVSAAVEDNVSASWRAPTLDEIAMEYLQDTYSGFNLTERSFLISGVRWYITGVVSTSSTTTDVTCYKDRLATVYDSIPIEEIEFVYPTMYKDDGGNYWKVEKKEIIVPDVVNPDGTITPGYVIPAETVHVDVEYMTIQCPGVTSAVVQATVSEYNNSVHTSIYESQSDSEGNTSGWTATVKVSVYIDYSGEIVVTGSIVTFYSSSFGWLEADARKAAIADVVGKVNELIDNEVKENLKRLVAYYNIAGVQKLKIADINRDLVGTSANAKAYPIIPLKENYTFINESRGMKVVLNKLGLSNGDFEESLTDEHINNASLMFLLELNDDSPSVVKAIYETFTKMVQTTAPGEKDGSRPRYSIDIGFAQVNFNTKVFFTLGVVSGFIGPIGTYTVDTRSVLTPGAYNGDGYDPDYYKNYTVICKQLTADYYEELELNPDSSTKWKVGGYELSNIKTGGDTRDLSGVYIPIVDIGLKALKYNELHYVLAKSLSIMVLSITVVKSKWYQSGFFKFVMIVVVAAVTIATAGATSGLAAAVIYAGGAVSILGIMGIDTGNLGLAVQVAAAIVTFGTSLSGSAFDIALASAQVLTQFAVIASNYNMKGAYEALQEKYKETQAALEESEKLVEEILESTQQGLWVGIQDRLPDTLYALSSTELMCNYDILYDYDSMYFNKINSVSNNV